MSGKKRSNLSRENNACVIISVKKCCRNHRGKTPNNPALLEREPF